MSPGNTTDRPPDARIPSPPLDRVAGIMGRLLETADVSKVYGEPRVAGHEAAPELFRKLKR